MKASDLLIKCLETEGVRALLRILDKAPETALRVLD